LNNPHLQFGLIHYYYGEGRGKTSTSIGTIIRALGHGLRPILIQFLKLHDENSKHSGFFIGEIHFLRKLIPIKQFGSYGFIYPDKERSEQDISIAQEGFKFAKNVILSGEYDLVVLDEIAIAIKLNLVKLEDLLDLLKKKPKLIEIIITGAVVIQELIEVADYCTEFSCVSHPYYKGYKARPGIEF
jgi:cob(I)alamin adenosyltransferase